VALGAGSGGTRSPKWKSVPAAPVLVKRGAARRSFAVTRPFFSPTAKPANRVPGQPRPRPTASLASRVPGQRRVGQPGLRAAPTVRARRAQSKAIRLLAYLTQSHSTGQPEHRELGGRLYVADMRQQEPILRSDRKMSSNISTKKMFAGSAPLQIRARLFSPHPRRLASRQEPIQNRYTILVASRSPKFIAARWTIPLGSADAKDQNVVGGAETSDGTRNALQPANVRWRATLTRKE
jgi:hypothetical protein